MSDIRIGAVIPALNEANTIYRIVEEVRQHVDDVVVVDDGSNDTTAETARKAGAIVLTNEHQLGQGASVHKGLSYLFQTGCHDIITLDSDGAHDPIWIPNLLTDHRKNSSDITIGSRFIDKSMLTGMPSPKIAANLFATGLINSLLGSTFTDVASGMRVVSENVMDLSMLSFNFAFAFDLLRSAKQANLNISECPISVRYNAEELHCTNKTELIHLIKYCKNTYNNVKLQSSFDHILSAIDSNAYFRVIVGTNLFCIHPVPKHHGFIFQIQNNWFRSSENESEVLLCLT